MRRLLTMILVVSAGFYVVRADDKAVQDDKKKLEGVWKPVSAEIDGKPVPDDQRPPTVEFKGEKLLGLGPEMSYVLDSSRKPKHIDLIAKVSGREVKVPAIYELKDDELTLCIPLTEKGKVLDLKRPSGFDSKAAPAMLIRLKRVT